MAEFSGIEFQDVKSNIRFAMYNTRTILVMKLLLSVYQHHVQQGDDVGEM